MTSRNSNTTVQIVLIILTMVYFVQKSINIYKIRTKRARYTHSKTSGVGEDIDELFYRIVSGLDTAANATIVDNEQSVSALSKLNTSCEQPPVHLIDATSTIGRKLIKRRKNKIRACVRNHANQLSYVGKCTTNNYYWPLGRLGAQYHVKPQIKTVGCMSPYHGGNAWSRLLNEQFEVNQLDAFNSPDWHRILVVEHPRIRFTSPLFTVALIVFRLYDTWDHLFAFANRQAAYHLTAFGINGHGTSDDEGSTHLITFEQFLNHISQLFLSDSPVPIELLAIYELCGICMRQYDYILKLETIGTGWARGGSNPEILPDPTTHP